MNEKLQQLLSKECIIICNSNGRFLLIDDLSKEDKKRLNNNNYLFKECNCQGFRWIVTEKGKMFPSEMEVRRFLAKISESLLPLKVGENFDITD